MTNKPRQAEGSTGCLDLPAAGPFWDRSSARSWCRVPNGSGLTDLSAIADLLFSPFPPGRDRHEMQQPILGLDIAPPRQAPGAILESSGFAPAIRGVYTASGFCPLPRCLPLQGQDPRVA